MESISTRSGKRHKSIKITDAKAGEEEDIFYNKLPESLVTHILSFLPTKDVVHTSVLSKRWERRWTSLTKLSLHDHYDSSPSPSSTPKWQIYHLRRKKNITDLIDFVNRAWFNHG